MCICILVYNILYITMRTISFSSHNNIIINSITIIKRIPMTFCEYKL